MEKRYKALRFIGSLYKVIGIIVGVITIVGALASCVFSTLSGSILENSVSRSLGNSTTGLGWFGGLLGGAIIGIILLLNGGFVATFLYAIGEGIYLLIHLEENTRSAIFFLRQDAKPAEISTPQERAQG